MATVYVASDHAGVSLKSVVLEMLAEEGHASVDLGAHDTAAHDDYPDVIRPAAQKVAADPGSFGIVLGGSGHGEAMVANRIAGVRAITFYGPRAAQSPLEEEGTASADPYDIVRIGRLHNDANILSIGARFVGEREAREAVRVFLETEFSTQERHARRISKF